MTSQNELLFRIPFGAHDEISQHMASMWVRLKVALGCDIAVLIMSKRKSQCKGAHPLMAPLFTKLYFSSKVT